MNAPAPTQATATPTPTPAPVVVPPVGADVKPAGGEVPVVAPTEPAPKIEVDPAVTSKHFVELKRREAEIKAKEEAVTKAAAERAKTDDADRKEFEEYKALKAKAKEKPHEAFAALGLTPNDIAKAMLHSEPEIPKAVQEALAKVAELEKKIADGEAAKTKAAQAEIDAKNIAAMKSKISETLKAPEFKRTARYEDTLEDGTKITGVDLVVDVMEAHWLRTYDPELKRGQVVDFKVAAAAVEKHFAKIAEADKAEAPGVDTKKEAEKSAESPKGSQKPAADPGTKTVVITNKTNADTPPSAPAKPDQATLRANAIRNHEQRMAAKRAALAAGKADQ